MKQVLLSGRGEVEVVEVPLPGPLPGSVLVRNAFSLISTGTEGAAVSRHTGWLAAVEKGLRSRARVKQVWDLARSQGIPRTWELVRHKLHESVAPGYSCAGQVVEVSGEDLPFAPGDLVACMGAGLATHSEWVVVPTNLVARLPEGVDLAEAAFGALACIALQGLRRLELLPGDKVGILGLGLIGQIAAQLAEALGYQAIGLDVKPERARIASELAGIAAWALEDGDAVPRTLSLTEGHGLDGVLICAATSSADPVNLAFDLCRKRGRVSLVGDVGLELQRAKMYAKELELRLSCSYGPGRYDESYEMEGRDYPYAYVRWTERRNLELVLSLLKRGRLKFERLATERFPIDRAVDGYARLKSSGPETLGVLLDYGPLPSRIIPPTREAYVVRTAPAPVAAAATGVVRLGLIGAGSFLRATHIPNLRSLAERFSVVGVASRTGASANAVARRVGAPLAVSDHRLLLEDPTVDAVLIATRHADHARLVIEALAAGKHVFVEKPLCLSNEEGQAIVAAARSADRILRVGFNRRFSPFLRRLRDGVGRSRPRFLTCRVNLGPLGDDWSNTPREGGRFLGEGVHFLDLANWFMAAWPRAISAESAGEPGTTNPNMAVSIAYSEGAAQVLYTSLGHAGLGKERFEAFGNGGSAACDDYRDVVVVGASSRGPEGRRGDKGHRDELVEFADAIAGRPGEGADAQAGAWATRLALAAVESARSGRRIELDAGEWGL